MTETPRVTDRPNNETGVVLPAESTHWYWKDGAACYEVASVKGVMRPTTLADARKMDLVPSVTNILNVAAKPGLEAWKTRQILEAALTLPKLPDESLDDYATRVIEDSKAQGKKAAERGTDLHAAIEQFIKDRGVTISVTWDDHVLTVANALLQHGIDIHTGNAEHSFASPLGYGGKVDFHNDELLLDFKSKNRIDEKVKPYDEHLMQCAAYAYGLGLNRAGNVFIGVEDKQVRVFLYEREELAEAFSKFQCLLEYWHRTKHFGKYEKDNK